MPVKDFFKSLFGASNKEVKGLGLLIITLVLVLIGLNRQHWYAGKQAVYPEEDKKLLDSLVTVLEEEMARKRTEKSKPKALFPFNPNVASEKVFDSLGFDKTVATRIVNYRAKGGKFYLKKDLYKIYGIDSLLIDTLYNYIDLPEAIYQKKARLEPQDSMFVARKPTKPRQQAVVLPDFDINRADTAMLQTIKGIGSVLSNRIVNYRDKLGGFIDLNQLYEVYNLDSVVAARLIDKAFIANNYSPKPLYINKVTEQELASHPYVSWQQARLIVAYRNQHGDFTSEEDLLKVYAVDEVFLGKIGPYLDLTSAN